MFVSQVNHGDRQIVGVLPTICVCVFHKAVEATLDEGPVKVFE
jgi:hypothetical protein